jgi:hypothetical protein
MVLYKSVLLEKIELGVAKGRAAIFFFLTSIFIAEFWTLLIGWQFDVITPCISPDLNKKQVYHLLTTNIFKIQAS